MGLHHKGRPHPQSHDIIIPAFIRTMRIIPRRILSSIITPAFIRFIDNEVQTRQGRVNEREDFMSTARWVMSVGVDDAKVLSLLSSFSESSHAA